MRSPGARLRAGRRHTLFVKSDILRHSAMPFVRLWSCTALRAAPFLQDATSRPSSTFSGVFTSSKLKGLSSAFCKATAVPPASMDPLLLVSDLDLTMVDHKDSIHTALLNFNLLWAAEYAHNSHLVYSTGRSMQRYMELQKDAPLLTPHTLILSIGTEIRSGSSLEVDKEWAKELDAGWNRDTIVEEALGIPGLRFQEEPDQGSHKVSFKVDKKKGEELQKLLITRLSERGLRVKVLYSSGIDLDVLPYKAGKGAALAYLLKKLGQEIFLPQNILVCGDSGNDIDLFTVDGVHGVIVSNAQDELLAWYQSYGSSAKIFHASRRCAGGIMEALQHFTFGPYLSPNERINEDYTPTFFSSEESLLPYPGAVHREVVEFRLFMMKWLLGHVSNSEQAFRRLSGVIGNGAKTISPEGVESDMTELLDGLRKNYGSMAGIEHQIWFDNICVQKLAERVYLVTWQPWEQFSGGKRQGSFASAILTLKDGTPNGLEWLHFHETFRSAG